MPLLRRKRVLAAKIETTNGTPISVSGTDAAFNVFDTLFQDTTEYIRREGQGSFSSIVGSIGPRGGTVSFSLDVLPGTTTHPAWALAFLPACGFVASTNVYTPRTEAPGTNVKTLTIGGFQDGLYKQISGAVGTAVWRFEAGKPVMIDFTFTGIWSDPTDVAIISPTYPTTHPLRFVSSALAVGSYAPKVNNLTLDFGNQVALREDSSTAAGYRSAIITGREATIVIDPESELVATTPWHTDFSARTERAISWALSEGGIGLSFSAPKAQLQSPQEGNRNDIQTEDLTFQLNRSAAAGDDELSITFDVTV